VSSSLPVCTQPNRTCIIILLNSIIIDEVSFLYLVLRYSLVLLLIYPERYVVSDKEGYDPAAEGKVWTTPAQDPALTGDMSRPAWLLTRETPGADLLAGELVWLKG
jgi:hypothetical protein